MIVYCRNGHGREHMTERPSTFALECGTCGLIVPKERLPMTDWKPGRPEPVVEIETIQPRVVAVWVNP